MSRKTAMVEAVLQRLEQGQVRKTRSTDQSKRVARDQRFFTQGVNLGAELMQARIRNSVAGLDYGESYYVPPTVDTGIADSGGDGVAVEGASVLGRPSESDTLPA